MEIPALKSFSFATELADALNFVTVNEDMLVHCIRLYAVYSKFCDFRSVYHFNMRSGTSGFLGSMLFRGNLRRLLKDGESSVSYISPFAPLGYPVDLVGLKGRWLVRRDFEWTLIGRPLIRLAALIEVYLWW